MRESIGYTVTINIIIVFMVLTIAFLLGSYSYSKAFRANSKIISSLEKYEGYNKPAKEELELQLKTLGYMGGNSTNCQLKRTNNKMDGVLVTVENNEKFDYCIYKFVDQNNNNYYSYGVLTYMTFDFYFFNHKLKIPVYGKTRSIYYFD